MMTNVDLCKLLFIGGFPSGGTDLIKTVINAHPEIDIRGEMPLLLSIEKQGFNSRSKFSDLESLHRFTEFLKKADVYNRIGNLDHDFSTALSKKDELSLEEALFSVLSKEVTSIRGFKTPQYTEQLQLLSCIFPNAKFVIVVRDVRDTCLSWSRKWGKDMVHCADKWARRMKYSFDYAQKNLQGRVLFVKYERLLDDTAATANEVCNFMGVQYSRHMLEHEKYTKEKIDGKLNYGDKIIVTNKEKWRTALSPARVRRIEEIAYDTMITFEYQPEYATQHIPIRFHEKLHGTINDLYAMFFVGNRALSRKNKIRIMIKSMYIHIKRWLS